MTEPLPQGFRVVTEADLARAEAERDRQRRERPKPNGAAREPALWADAAAFDPATIPARPWVATGLALRGAVTLLTGPGAAAKTTITINWAVALALALRLGRFRPVAAGRTLILNAEDDRDELRRRLAAACIAQNVSIAEAASAIVRVGPALAATLLEVHPDTGTLRTTTAWTELGRLIAEHRPDMVVLDPLVELHSAEENDNVRLRAVVARLRALAQLHNCAVVLVHHGRKGAVAGDQDGARGASSIASASRLHITATPMTAEEAETFGLPAAHRRSFVRLDVGKANAAPAWEADWVELRSIDLPNGDAVAAAVPWSPVKPAADTAALATAAAAIARGWGGEPCSESPNSAAYFGHALDAAGIGRALHRDVLAALKADGTVAVRAWRDPGARKTFRRLQAVGSAFDGWV
jgi:hypothetical protein